MTERTPVSPAPPPALAAGRPGVWAAAFRDLATLRNEASAGQTFLFNTLFVVLVFILWWYVTRGEGEERVLPYTTLQSPRETFGQFHSLWFERALTRNTLASLRRVTIGFGLAVVVGVPLGVLCGCFSWLNAFFLPLSIFGRNIPVAALIPLTFSLFGIGELQKVMFIFIACVAFVLTDTARAVKDVGQPYVDTAYTLGAGRWQVIMKVLVPLSLPDVFNSLRLLFGLAFGYIMLAELVKFGGESGGLGDIILTAQRRGPREYILLVLLIIPVVALAIDRVLYWVQRELFPYRYGGSGLLNKGVRAMLRAWDDLKMLVRKPSPAAQAVLAAARKGSTPQS